MVEFPIAMIPIEAHQCLSSCEECSVVRREAPLAPQSKVPAAEPVRRVPEKQQDRAKAADPVRPKDRALSGRAAVDEYLKLSGVIESAKAAGDYKKAVRAARNSFPLMPAVIARVKKEFGRFDIATSHAIHTGGTLMAVMEDAEGIEE